MNYRFYCRKDVTFLQQLAKGSLVPEKERQTIIPVIYVFCTMFRHALFCIYDIDFYSPDAGKLIFHLVLEPVCFNHFSIKCWSALTKKRFLRVSIIFIFQV